MRESEEKYRILFEHTGEALFVAQDGRIVFHNPRSSELMGYSAREFQSRPFIEFIYEDDREMVMDRYLRRLRKEKPPERYSFRIVHKNGRILWVQINAVLIEWDGKPATLNFISDITERKCAEEELVKEADRRRILMEQSRDGIVIIDQAGQVIESNRRFAEMLGYPLESMCQLKVFDWECHYPPDRTMEMLNSVDEKGHYFETRHRRRDGGIYDVEISSNAVWFDGQKLIFCICRDITERKVAEQSLAESEARYKALHNASFGGIAIHDQGVILECNQGLAEMTGYQYSELIGMDGLLLIAERSREVVMNNIRTGYEKPYEAYGVRKNGEEIPLQVEARNVPYKGRQVRTVEFRDISERKQADAEREQLQEQLSQAKKMESIGRLAGGVAHDFNNMLGVILGYVEFALEKAEKDSSLYDDLKEIQNAAQRSADITKQLLAFARKQTICPRQLDLNDTVESMLNMLRRLIGEDIDLVWQPAAGLWPVKMDPSQVIQILANLCGNARHAISGVGKVYIETGKQTFGQEYCSEHPDFIPGDFVLLAFSDNGCGMDKDTLDNLFEPFFTTKKVGEGTGLGLATIYGIVKQNNGFINVYSEPGRGSTFKIYLPRWIADKEADRAVCGKKTAAGGTETILLVEDELSILRMIRIMLKRKGYTVLSAATPTEAFEKAKNHFGSIDLLMTDVVMPEMHGRDLAEKIMEIYPDIRLLFMSGYTANVIAHQGVLHEGVAFIQKPFSNANLAKKLREVLDTASDKTQEYRLNKIRHMF